MGGIGIAQIVPFATTCPTVHPIPGRNGQTGIIPKFISYAVSNVHPIPLYHGRDWTNKGCTMSHLLCPVHCTYYPIHCTVGGNGQTGIIPKCPICYACPSHPMCGMTDTSSSKMEELLPGLRSRLG